MSLCNAALQDELATTTRSYEGQLSMMSEHLAGMNDKLTAQTDEIDALKYQLNHKVPANKTSYQHQLSSALKYEFNVGISNLIKFVLLQVY